MGEQERGDENSNANGREEELVAELMTLGKKQDMARVLALLNERPGVLPELAEATDEGGRQMLHWAVLAGEENLVGRLVADHGARVDAVAASGQTPLMWAAGRGKVGMINLLLAHSVDKARALAARDSYGRTPFSFSLKNEKWLAMILLEAHGADVHQADANGYTAAHWAAMASEDALRILTAWGVDFSRLDKDERTPLHLAAMSNNVATVEYLLGPPHKLDPSQKDKEGWTAFELAQLHPEADAVLELLKSGQPSVEASDTPSQTDVNYNHVPDGQQTENKPRNFSARVLQRINHFIFRFPFFLPVMTSHIPLLWGLTWWREILPVMSRCQVFQNLPLDLQDEMAQSPLANNPQNASGGFFALFCASREVVRFILASHSALQVVYVAYGLVMGLTIYLVFADPGRQPSRIGNPAAGIAELQSHLLLVTNSADRKNKAVAMNRLCGTCWIYKDLRIKHCSRCDRCIAEFDHHCAWLDNCVGRQNHRQFLFWISVGHFIQVLHFLVSVLSLVTETLFFRLARSPPASLASSCWNTVKTMPLTSLVLAIHVPSIAFVFTLTRFQWKNVAENITVNETICWTRYDHFIGEKTVEADGEKAIVQFQQNPFDRGSVLANCNSFWNGKRSNTPKVTKAS